MRLIAARRLDLALLVTAAGSLTDWHGLFDASLARAGLKYVIDPRP